MNWHNAPRHAQWGKKKQRQCKEHTVLVDIRSTNKTFDFTEYGEQKKKRNDNNKETVITAAAAATTTVATEAQKMVSNASFAYSCDERFHARDGTHHFRGLSVLCTLYGLCVCLTFLSLSLHLIRLLLLYRPSDHERNMCCCITVYRTYV